MPDLQAYLERIGYAGTPTPDLHTLTGLHRRHLLAIPYENLDVQLERPVGLDIEPIFDKLVLRRRGGWCYEMNGLFAWAIEEIGFRITRLAAGVRREQVGDAALGNHLALCVHLDEPYLADVGFGDGLFEPVPMRPGAVSQRGFDFRLEHMAGSWWRVHNHAFGGAPSFDFQAVPGDRSLMERKCAYLQTAPESPFRLVAVVQRHIPDGIVVLRGRVLTRLRAVGPERRVIEDRFDYERTLRETFDLDAPDLDVLWAKVEEQHRAFMRQQALDSGAQARGA